MIHESLSLHSKPNVYPVSNKFRVLFEVYSAEAYEWDVKSVRRKKKHLLNAQLTFLKLDLFSTMSGGFDRTEWNDTKSQLSITILEQYRLSLDYSIERWIQNSFDVCLFGLGPVSRPPSRTFNEVLSIIPTNASTVDISFSIENKVYDGPSIRSPVLLSTIDKIPSLHTVTSSSNEILVRLTTDDSVQRTGFLIIYSSVSSGH